MVENKAVIKTVGLNAYFGAVNVLRNVDFEVYANQILGVIGPANSGKTTFLRAINRLNYLQPNYRQEGQVYFNDLDISRIKDGVLRKKIGIIFALPQVHR